MWASLLLVWLTHAVLFKRVPEEPEECIPPSQNLDLRDFLVPEKDKVLAGNANKKQSDLEAKDAKKEE